VLDYVTRLLFEDLPLLLVAEAIALAVVLAIHRRRFTPHTRRAVWITLGVCAIFIVIQSLVTTRREALEAMVRTLAQAVDHGDVPAIGERIDGEFRHGNHDKKAFLDGVVKQTLQRWQVDEAKVAGFKIEINGDNATVSFRAHCDCRSDNHVQYKVPSFWTLNCIRRPDGWKLLRIPKARCGPGGSFNVADLWH